MFINKLVFLLLFVNSAVFSFSQEKKITVYAFVAEECPISIFMASALKSVAETYASSATFYLVFPTTTSTTQSATAFKTTNQLTRFMIKVDNDQIITKKLNATVTPEVVITGADETVLYRGRINDAYAQPGKRKHVYANNDLAGALENIVNGREMPKPWKQAVGCYITHSKEQP